MAASGAAGGPGAVGGPGEADDFDTGGNALDADIITLFRSGARERDARLGPFTMRLPAGTQADRLDKVPDGRPVTDNFGSMLPYVSARVRAAFF